MLWLWLRWLVGAAWTVVTWPLRRIEHALRGGNQAYASFDHIALNVRPPQTEWLNMGNWSATECFPDACEALARHLYSQAGIALGASILDVGHGCGDSLLLLARDYRPRLLHGVTSLPSHAQRAQRRLAEQEKRGEQDRAPLSWRVICDDAVEFVQRNDGPKYDFILALDCAYHFDTRVAFLHACSSRLKPGGKVALLDLVAAHPYPRSQSSGFFTPSPTLPAPTGQTAPLAARVKHRITTLMTGVPIGNLVSIHQYHATLRQAGYDGITISDSSHLVFPGFSRFLQRLGRGEEAAWRGGGLLQTPALRSFGAVVQGWSKGGEEGMVRSVVVVAEKGRQGEDK